MSRTCDGLRAVNVGGGGAEVLSGGRRRRRSAFRRAFGALIARGSGRGLPKALMGGREIFRRLFLSTSRRFFLRAAKASFSAARRLSDGGAGDSAGGARDHPAYTQNVHAFSPDGWTWYTFWSGANATDGRVEAYMGDITFAKRSLGDDLIHQ